MLELLGAIGGIVLVDLALSGDNALVIGAAAAALAPRQRTQAIFLGGAGAIVLRILFAIAATLLLLLPFVQALGGLVLLYIAARLLMERTGKHEEQVDERAKLIPRAADDQPSASDPTTGVSSGFTRALFTILVADVTMSLDNVLAIGALARGELPVLIVGLLLSIALVLAGSALVASLIRRLPWLLDVAALVLGWTAASMALHDLRLGPWLHAHLPYAEIALYALGVGIVLAVDIWFRVRHQRSQRPERVADAM
ncbi:MAG TPA: YjbE family putative metal transport protein [Ktedonobacterales bacterium]|jgi:YjbE family integral membrane protein|nr:YjbE family putative metal transport protein [Ktedonobacterales bacterium]